MKALRSYEHTSSEQPKEMSNVVTNHEVNNEAVEAGHEAAVLPEKLLSASLFKYPLSACIHM